MTHSIRYASLLLLSGLAIPMIAPDSANAVVVTVAGVPYDVSVSTTAYDTNTGAFQLPSPGQMPWWGNATLASDFATKVFDQLGPGWDPDYGPVFAHAIDLSLSQVLGIGQSITDLNDQIDVTPMTSSLVSYAIAETSTPVPAPVPVTLPLFGAAAAFGWSRRMRTRMRAGTRPTH